MTLQEKRGLRPLLIAAAICGLFGSAEAGTRDFLLRHIETSETAPGGGPVVIGDHAVGEFVAPDGSKAWILVYVWPATTGNPEDELRWEWLSETGDTPIASGIIPHVAGCDFDWDKVQLFNTGNGALHLMAEQAWPYGPSDCNSGRCGIQVYRFAPNATPANSEWIERESFSPFSTVALERDENDELVTYPLEALLNPIAIANTRAYGTQGITPTTPNGYTIFFHATNDSEGQVPQAVASYTTAGGATSMDYDCEYAVGQDSLTVYCFRAPLLQTPAVGSGLGAAFDFATERPTAFFHHPTPWYHNQPASDELCAMSVDGLTCEVASLDWLTACGYQEPDKLQIRAASSSYGSKPMMVFAMNDENGSQLQPWIWRKTESEYWLGTEIDLDWPANTKLKSEIIPGFSPRATTIGESGAVKYVPWLLSFAGNEGVPSLRAYAANDVEATTQAALGAKFKAASMECAMLAASGYNFPKALYFVPGAVLNLIGPNDGSHAHLPKPSFNPATMASVFSLRLDNSQNAAQQKGEYILCYRMAGAEVIPNTPGFSLMEELALGACIDLGCDKAVRFAGADIVSDPTRVSPRVVYQITATVDQQAWSAGQLNSGPNPKVRIRVSDESAFRSTATLTKSLPIPGVPADPSPVTLTMYYVAPPTVSNAPVKVEYFWEGACDATAPPSIDVTSTTFTKLLDGADSTWFRNYLFDSSYYPQPDPIFVETIHAWSKDITLVDNLCPVRMLPELDLVYDGDSNSSRFHVPFGTTAEIKLQQTLRGLAAGAYRANVRGKWLRPELAGPNTADEWTNAPSMAFEWIDPSNGVSSGQISGHSTFAPDASQTSEWFTILTAKNAGTRGLTLRLTDGRTSDPTPGDSGDGWTFLLQEITLTKLQ